MLGTKYNFRKDHCMGTRLIKNQKTEIRIKFDLPKPGQISTETSMTVLNQDKPLYGFGYLY